MGTERSLLEGLQRVPLLAGLGAESLERFAAQTRSLVLQRQEVVYRPNDASDAIYFVLRGRVRTALIRSAAKVLTLAYRGPGELFGEAAAFVGGPRNEQAEAMAPSELAVVGREDFRQLLEREPAVLMRFAELVVVRRRELEQRVGSLAFQRVRARVAGLLLRLAEEEGVDDRRGRMVKLALSRQELASLIGTSRETLSTTITQLAQRGLIEVDGRWLVVVNPKELEEMT